MLAQFGWSPVTWEFPSRNTLRIARTAWYDDVENEVRVDDDVNGRYVGVQQVLDRSDQGITFLADNGEKMVVRQTIAADAAKWDYLPLRIDLPVEIIGALMSNTTTFPKVTAAVDDQGDVHTMVLETSLGLFARYARTWIRMGDISPIESLDIVDVPADDLEIYDQADDAGRTPSIGDMHPLGQGNDSAIDVTPAPGAEPVTAAGQVVVIASAADLDDAIAFAATPAGVENRWYVTRKARSLGHTDPLPWEDQ